MTEGGFGYPERRIDVGFKGGIKRSGAQLFNGFAILLSAGIVHQNIQPAQLGYRFFNQGVAKRFNPNIAGNGDGFSSLGLNQRDNGSRVRLFFRQVADGDIRAFTRIGDSDSAANT